MLCLCISRDNKGHITGITGHFEDTSPQRQGLAVYQGGVINRVLAIRAD